MHRLLLSPPPPLPLLQEQPGQCGLPGVWRGPVDRLHQPFHVHQPDVMHLRGQRGRHLRTLQHVCEDTAAVHPSIHPSLNREIRHIPCLHLTCSLPLCHSSGPGWGHVPEHGVCQPAALDLRAQPSHCHRRLQQRQHHPLAGTSFHNQTTHWALRALETERRADPPVPPEMSGRRWRTAVICTTESARS